MPCARSTPRIASFAAWIVLGPACLRAPIYYDPDGGLDASAGSEADSSSAGTTSDPPPEDDTSTTAGPPATCHASYRPCLPVVDDMNCDEVRALGVAPVEVIGDDPYGLDSDHDGIGCET